MSATELSAVLAEKDIKPTPNRLLVLSELMKAKSPVSLADLERLLDTIDKASIFRVLELFSAKEMVHVIEDGSRSLKYELCHGGAHHSPSDQHVHFFCEKCGEVFCLEDISVPAIAVPEGFRTRSVNYMLKGYCPGCAQTVNDQH